MCLHSLNILPFPTSDHQFRYAEEDGDETQKINKVSRIQYTSADGLIMLVSAHPNKYLFQASPGKHLAHGIKTGIGNETDKYGERKSNDLVFGE